MFELSAPGSVAPLLNLHSTHKEKSAHAAPSPLSRKTEAVEKSFTDSREKQSSRNAVFWVAAQPQLPPSG